MALFDHEDYMNARRRRLEANAMIARGDPGRFSSFERNALLGMQHTKGGDIALVDNDERTGLRQHEMDMLKQRGENEFKVAQEKRFGMREQGSDAAKFGADAEIKKAQTEWGARQAIAQTEAEAKKYGADRGLSAAELEWGKNGSDGTRIAGGREAVAGIEGKSRVDAAREQAKIAAEQNEQRRALEEQKRLVADERAKADREFKYSKLDEQAKKDVDAAANKLVEASMGKLSFSDARAQVMAEREQAQQQGEESKEGETKTLSSGRKVIFKNGKWQYAD